MLFQMEATWGETNLTTMWLQPTTKTTLLSTRVNFLDLNLNLVGSLAYQK